MVQIAEVAGYDAQAGKIVLHDIFNRRTGDALSPTGFLPTFVDSLMEKRLLELEFLYGADRLTQPLLRKKNGVYAKDGEFTAVGWDEAFDVMAAQFKRVLKEKGSDAIGMFGSGQWTIFAILTLIVYPLLLRRVARRRQQGEPDESGEVVVLGADGEVVTSAPGPTDDP